MPTHNAYFPVRVGDQIIWLRKYRNRISTYQTAGGYTSAEIAATVADADYCIHLLETWQPGAVQFAQAATAHLKTILYGPIPPGAVTLPIFNGNPPSGSPPPPSSIPWPAAVAPGALKRIFAFIKNLKTRTFYNPAVGADLDIVGEEITEDPNATPDFTATARAGEVLLTFKKDGHLGVWIESQIGNETEWTHISTDTSSPYHDTRPLKVAGQPEKRRYRLCFWDGDPTRVWTAVMEVVFGG